MPSPLMTRRAFAAWLAAAPAGLSATRGLLGPTGHIHRSAPSDGDGLTHNSEAIHQEMTFDASRHRVYAALTETSRFDRVTRLSDGKELLAAPGAKPTTISVSVGGPFTLFGGYITGRHLELAPGERLVQAWRTASWKPGEYSIVSFVLHDEGPKSRLVFDHRGFPDGTGSHLATGWHAHYWDPLTKYLAG
jgi:activator of HSP90 ATPase